MAAETFQVAAHFLRQEWSPEQVSSVVPVSHETLYQYVYADKSRGGDLWRSLRCQKKKRKRYASGRPAPARSLTGVRFTIDLPRLKPATVGHWEGDTIIGAGHSRGPLFRSLSAKSGLAVGQGGTQDCRCRRQAIIDPAQALAVRVSALTYKREGIPDHARIDAELGSTGSFADPFASWQRGTNENTNGLVRQYIPKKRPLSTITDEELKMIEDRVKLQTKKKIG